MSALVPSPALMLPADTPIAECVRRMNDRKVGSVLIIRDTQHYPEHGYKFDGRIELMGIFTERDLLVHLEEIRNGDRWLEPVNVVMTRKIVTLPVSQLHKAGELMLHYGFRHVPVVQENAKGRQEIVGVISMRDLLRQQIEEEKADRDRPAPIIGVLTRSAQEVRALSTGLFSNLKADLRAIDPLIFTQDLSSPSILDALLIDVDRQDIKTWPSLLKRINQARQLPLTIVIFDPMAHEPKVVATLDKIKDTAKFAVFHKPVNLLELMRRIRKIS